MAEQETRTLREDFHFLKERPLVAVEDMELHYLLSPMAGQDTGMARASLLLRTAPAASPQTETSPYVLDGEVDRQGHPIVRDVIPPSFPKATAYFRLLINKSLDGPYTGPCPWSLGRVC